MNALKFFKKSDMIVIIGIIGIAGIFWFVYSKTWAPKPRVGEIYYGSELIERVPLDTGIESSFSVVQGENVVFHLSSEGEISFESSNCPDQVCVRSGKLSQVGESAACLPNQLILKIVPSEENMKNTTDIII